MAPQRHYFLGWFTETQMEAVAQSRLSPGDSVRPFVLPCIDGSAFDSSSLVGKRFMLAFFRFASCPFCNMRVQELCARYSEFGEDFGIIGVFDATLEDLTRHAGRHDAPFPILADEAGAAYESYAIEKSVAGFFRGMVFRAPTLVKAMSKGYVPTAVNRGLTTMPAEFLINEQGIIKVAYYGNDEGDHLPVEEVVAFSRTRGW